MNQPWLTTKRVDDLNAGIADQHVDAAKRRDRGSHAVVDRLFIGHVHGNTDGNATAGIDLVSRGVGRVLAEIGSGDPGTLAREDDCDFPANTAGCASDDGGLVLEFHGDLRLRSKILSAQGHTHAFRRLLR
jgi:hypothetical protein